MLHMKIDLFVAFHLQTNGQTERVNQVLEQYLRCTISYHQDDCHLQNLPIRLPNMPQHIIHHFLQIIDGILNLTLSILKMMFLILLWKTLQYKCKLSMMKIFLILKKLKKNIRSMMMDNKKSHHLFTPKGS